MNGTAHPDWDELLARNQADFQPDTNTAAHLAGCPDCRHRLAEAKQLRDRLQTMTDFQALSQDDEGHLRDVDIAAYAHERLDAAARERLDDHLRQCGWCMKEVLRTRAHLAARTNPDATPIPSSAPVRLHRAARMFTTSDSHVSHHAKQRRPAPWKGALAASIALASLAAWLTAALWQDEARVADVAPDARDLDADIVSPGAPSALSTQRVARDLDKDGIDWYGGYIQTTATGTADMTKVTNEVQAEIIAETAARHLAYAQLAELINGVHVRGNAVYREFLMQASNLAAETEGFIRGAHVMRKNVEWIGGVPRASVTLRLPLHGANGLSGVIAGQHADAQSGNQQRLDNIPDSPLTTQGPLIIDARHLSYIPALQLTVQADGDVLDIAERPHAHAAGVKIHYQSGYRETDATVIKATAATAPGTVTVSSRDAAALRAYLAAFRGRQAADVTVVF